MGVSSIVSGTSWDEYVLSHAEATLDHAWAWREVITRVFGHDCEYLAAYRSDTVVGVLPLVLFRSRLFGRSVISLPFLNYGGVVADDDEAARALLEQSRSIAKRFGAACVELRHRRRLFPDLPSRTHKLSFTRPLPASSDVLWAELDRKIRNQVRKAQKEGLVPASGGAELVGEFYQVFARNMRDLGTPVYSRRFFEEALSGFGDGARVFVVRQAGVAVAAGVSIRWRDTVLVPWASSLREYRHLCPNMLLYWAMLERAIADGATTFDFGRSSAGSGPQQFKRQWGAAEAPLHWEYVLEEGRAIPDTGPSSPRFRTAVAVWSRLPLWLANAAGPHIVRSIP